jgi:hypothetical protein
MVTAEITDSWFRLSHRPTGVLAAFAALVDSDPGDLDAILETLALVHPLMRDARGAYRKLPPVDQYLGPHQSVIMASFVVPSPSRFTAGVFGVLYGGDTIETALAEVSHHQTRRLAASVLPYGTMVQLTSWRFRITAPLVDIRTDRSSIYDPDFYGDAQQFGRSVRDRGDAGIVYRSLRRPTNTSVGVLRPRYIIDVARHTDWRLFWNGQVISEWLAAK